MENIYLMSSVNKASSLFKRVEELLIEKMTFQKVKWTISLKTLELRLWRFLTSLRDTNIHCFVKCK